MAEIIKVFAFQSVEQIFRRGGTQSWKVNLKRASRCNYVVLVRNAHDKRRPKEATEPHHSAFMVGRLRDIVPAPEPHSKSSLLRFSEYCLVSVPNCWSGDRNPVAYTSAEDLGFDPDQLTEWQPMPEPPPAIEAEPTPPALLAANIQPQLRELLEAVRRAGYAEGYAAAKMEALAR